MSKAESGFKVGTGDGDKVEHANLCLWVPKSVKDEFDRIQEECKKRKVKKEKYFSKFCSDLIAEAVKKAQT